MDNAPNAAMTSSKPLTIAGQDERHEGPGARGAVQGGALAAPGADPDARAEWAAKLRRLFSPPAMLLPDGSINQDYFRPQPLGRPHPLPPAQ
jgi:hypothetical protein